MTMKKTKWRRVKSLGKLLAFCASKSVVKETYNNADYGVMFDDGSVLRVMADCDVWSTWTQEHDVAFWVTDHMVSSDDMYMDLPD